MGHQLKELSERAAGALPARPEADPYAVYLATLRSPVSRTTMAGCLDQIARMLAAADDDTGLTGAGQPWHAVRYAHVAEISSRLSGRGYSPSTVNKHLSALRGVLRQAWQLGLMTTDDYMRAVQVRNARGHREPAGRSIHMDEISAMITACVADGNEAAGLRDAALVAVLQSTGIRVAEAAGATMDGYDPAERSLRIIGKGDKERTVYVSPSAVPYLERWLARRGRRRGPLFTSVDRHGNIGGGHVSTTALAGRVRVRRLQAGLSPLSPHDFRRTFAGEMFDTGADVSRVQRAMGHARVDTTTRYDRRPLRGVRDAIDRLPELPSV